MSLTGLNGSKLNWGDVKEDTPIGSIAPTPAAAAPTASSATATAPAAAPAAAATLAASVSAPPAAAAAAVESVAGDLSKATLASPDEEDDVQLAAYSGLHPNDKTAEVSVTVAQDDAASSSGAVNPTIYRAVETFDQLGLTKELLSGVYAMKFTTPSKIQAQALPIIMSQQHPNLIGQAHHGSGQQKHKQMRTSVALDWGRCRKMSYRSPCLLFVCSESIYLSVRLDVLSLLLR